MQITIKIDAPELVGAVNNLAVAMGGKATSNKNTSIKEEKGKKPETKQDSKETKEDKSDSQVKTFKPEELRAKAAEVSKSGKREEVKALLTKFEVKNITSVPEERSAEFMSALEAL
ncbi:hypothetical protein VQL36_19470 [Chengkuizengella sp. SCS-71B]|uniref:hypothetical protein n=1 Tax=Chengkuizengella sp. SCS-71B TaxID=3115290 RepID=UPI0032C217E3